MNGVLQDWWPAVVPGSQLWIKLVLTVPREARIGSSRLLRSQQQKPLIFNRTLRSMSDILRKEMRKMTRNCRLYDQTIVIWVTINCRLQHKAICSTGSCLETEYRRVVFYSAVLVFRTPFPLLLHLFEIMVWGGAINRTIGRNRTMSSEVKLGVLRFFFFLSSLLKFCKKV